MMLISAELVTANRAISAKSFGGKSTPPAFTTSSSGPLDSARVRESTRSEETRATRT